MHQRGRPFCITSWTSTLFFPRFCSLPDISILIQDPDSVNGRTTRFFCCVFCKKTICSNTVIHSPTNPTDFLLHVMSIRLMLPVISLTGLSEPDTLRSFAKFPSSCARKIWLTSILYVKLLSHCDPHLFITPTPNGPLKVKVFLFPCLHFCRHFTGHDHITVEAAVQAT